MVASIFTQDLQIEKKFWSWVFVCLFISTKDSNTLVEASLGVHKSVLAGYN